MGSACLGWAEFGRISGSVADVTLGVGVVSLDSAFVFSVFGWTPRVVDETPGAVELLLV